jgi:hypothetical protein
MTTASPQPQPLKQIALPPKGRGVLIGETGTGKSYLAMSLMAHWLRNGKNPRLLVVDTKPRFRAELELNGLPTKRSRRYKGMEHGDAIPGAYVLPLANPRRELQQVWRLGGHAAIAQIDDLADLPAVEAAIEAMYHDSRAGIDQLVYIDELADFYSSSPSFRRGSPILKVVRSGRERGVAALVAAQRPRNIPTAVLTETTNLYMFRLANRHDWKHLQDMSLPEHLQPPEGDHVFLFYNKPSRQAGYHRLAKPQESRA